MRALLTLVLAAAVAAPAHAAYTWDHEPGSEIRMEWSHKQKQNHNYKHARSRALSLSAEKCRGASFREHHTNLVTRAKLGEWDSRRLGLHRARKLHKRQAVKPTDCVPTDNREIIRAVWPDHLETQALQVAYCESVYWKVGSGTTKDEAWKIAHLAVNPTNPRVRGLFQIDVGWYPPGFNEFDPWQNARLALHIYLNYDKWSHWHCKPWYNPFGPDGDY